MSFQRAAELSEKQVLERKTCPNLALIILAYNGWQDTLECLESIFQSNCHYQYQVVVVDNGSSDGSAEKVKEWADGRTQIGSRFFEYEPGNKPIPYVEYHKPTAESGVDGGSEQFISCGGGSATPQPLVIIRTGDNLGFAGGANVGIRYALSTKYSYIGLLNNDAVVDAHALAHLIDTLDSNNRIGVLGPKILWYDSPSVIWYAGASSRLWRGDVPHMLGMGYRDSPVFLGTRNTEFVTGCALFAKREVFEAIGLFNEDYFIIHEDCDFCLRVKKDARFQICVALGARVWHKAGGISQARNPNWTSTYFSNKHRLMLVLRHAGVGEKTIFTIFYAVTRIPKFLALLFRGRHKLIEAECVAVVDFWRGRFGPSDRDKIVGWERGGRRP
jgi:hypothetical protein